MAVTQPGLAPGEESAVREAAPGEVREALDDLGAALARNEDAARYDLSEDAHRGAIEQMEAMADDLVLDLPSLVATVRDFLIDVIKHRPKPWGATSPAEQRDVAAACEQLSDGLVRQIVETIRADGRQSVRVLLTKVTLGDDTQIMGKLKALAPEEEDAAVMMLHHARGKHVLLTVASVDDYKQEHRSAKTDEEEPALPFEAGDNDDLAGEEDEPGRDRIPDHVKTGDEFNGIKLRVNLKEQMVQALPEGSTDSDFDWVDEREATPEELAAERDRVADFPDDEVATAAEDSEALATS